ncbi:MAG: leucine-rich repeat domain-containing protein [Bacteroidota bacterium]
MERTILSVSWWHALSSSWKQAFAETCFRHNGEPNLLELEQVYSAPALRFAGPGAPYPNMSLELEDLSGLKALNNLEILVFTHHRLKNVAGIEHLFGLKSLFLNNNQINNLQGIEGLTVLRQLYVQHNYISSIHPIAGLVHLEELYIHDNLLDSLEGITDEHAEKLDKLICKPNEGLKQKELIRVEREFGIRCRSL